MKRVLTLFLFFILFTLSYAFHPESLQLSQVINHQHQHNDANQIKPESDGSDSPNILLPTESSNEPDHTESLPVESKEAVSELENPAQMENMFTFPVYRLKPSRCRQVNRFMRHPRRVNKLDVDPVLTYVISNSDVSKDFLEAIRMFDQNYMMEPLHRPRHHHRHHHHNHDDDEDDDDDDQLVEMKEDDQDKEEREKGLKKKREEEDDDEHEDHHKERHNKKKRKEKNLLNKKHKRRNHDDVDDEHEDDDNMEKYVLKKIRKFMNFF